MAIVVLGVLGSKDTSTSIENSDLLSQIIPNLKHEESFISHKEFKRNLVSYPGASSRESDNNLSACDFTNESYINRDFTYQQSWV